MVLDDILVLPIANHHGIENLGPQYGDTPDDRHHDDHGLSRPHPAVRLHPMPGSRGHTGVPATAVSLNDGHTTMATRDVTVEEDRREKNHSLNTAHQMRTASHYHYHTAPNSVAWRFSFLNEPRPWVLWVR